VQHVPRAVDAGKFFHEPSDRAIAQQPVRHRRRETAELPDPVGPDEQPIAPADASLARQTLFP
jgi:hypothetical protein